VSVNRARFVLDAFALLAYLENEPGAARVNPLIEDADKQTIVLGLTIINFAEVLYITEREKGLIAARAVISAVDRLPIVVVDADRDLSFRAARLKSRYPLSFADAFAAALAQKQNAALVTGDREFRKVESLITIVWLPQA
jgi:predicted nucleic acid-binding protein